MNACLATIAESEKHARWIVENHTSNGTERPRCEVCDTWWPCNTLGLAALAVLQANELEVLRAAASKDRRQLEMFAAMAHSIGSEANTLESALLRHGKP